MMKILRNLRKRLPMATRTIYVEYWESINEMPLENWIQCNDGKFEFSRKTQKKGDEATEQDAEKWLVIYNDYIKQFGLSDMYKKLLELMRKKAMLELDFVETRQRFKLTEIELATEKLKTLLSNNGEGLTIQQSLIHLSKWLGYHLKATKITVLEYFNLMAEYGKANK